VTATARSAREQTNPTTRPTIIEIISAAKSNQKIAQFFRSCPIKSAVREGELDRRDGY